MRGFAKIYSKKNKEGTMAEGKRAHYDYEDDGDGEILIVTV